MFSSTVIWTCFSLLVNTIAVRGEIRNSMFSFSISDFRKCLDTDTVAITHRIVQITLSSCVEHCVTRSDCQAVNYRRRLKLCELLDQVNMTGNTIDNDASTGGCVSIYMDTVKNSAVTQRCSCSVGQSCDIATKSCSITDCPKLTLTNGVIVGNMYNVGSTLKFFCHEYHSEKNGMISSTCLTTGQWSYQPECIIDCGEPMAVNNSLITNGSTLLDSIREYNCSDGYIMVFGTIQTSETVCTSNATWTPVEFTCIIHCGDPPTFAYSTISAGSNLVRSTRIYTCFAGYTMNITTQATTICRITGVWSAVDFTCVLDCGEPPSVSYALPSYVSTTENSVCSYTCNYGFGPDPADAVMDILCEATGDWSSVTFACLVDCGPPPTLPNATISTGSTLIHTKRTYTCVSGFAASPEGSVAEIYCKTDGSWSTVTASCVNDCGEPPSISNTMVSSGSTILYAIRTYTCLNGYGSITGYDKDNTTCMNNGAWSTVYLVCEIDCGEPGDILNAIASPGSTIKDSERTYTCKSGFTVDPLTAIVTTKCDDNGQWSDVTMTCVPETTIGTACNSDSDCTETGSVCLSYICFCGPTYRYNSSTKTCLQVCNAVSNSFMYIPDKVIMGYNVGFFDSITMEACEAKCSDDQYCLSIDYYNDFKHCFLNTVTYFMILDSDSANVIDGSSTTIGYKICL